MADLALIDPLFEGCAGLRGFTSGQTRAIGALSLTVRPSAVEYFRACRGSTATRDKVAGEEAMPMIRHRTTDRTVAGKGPLEATDTSGRIREEQTLDRVLLSAHCDSEVVIPLLREEVVVQKEVVETGRVAVTLATREHSELISEPLATETVEISRVPIGRPVKTMPAVRDEGDTVVIPVVEERLLVERQLFLKEEVRVRRVRTSGTHQESVTLRHHEVTVKRHPGAGVRQQEKAADGPPQSPFVSMSSPTGEGR